MGVGSSLVTLPVFKTGGGRIPSPVGSIPIYSRQIINAKPHKQWLRVYFFKSHSQQKTLTCASIAGDPGPPSEPVTSLRSMLLSLVVRAAGPVI